MKTENLTPVEAGQAYFDGKRIKSSLDNWEYWIENGWRKSLSEHRTLGCSEPTFFKEDATFSIVQPEVKTLSFEDRLAALEKEVFKI